MESLKELMTKVRKGIIKYEDLDNFKKLEYRVYIAAYEKRKEYYQKNKEKFKLSQMRWRKNNPEKVAQYQKSWAINDKHKWGKYKETWKKIVAKYGEISPSKLQEEEYNFISLYKAIKGDPNEKEIMEAYVIK